MPVDNWAIRFDLRFRIIKEMLGADREFNVWAAAQPRVLRLTERVLG